MQFRLKAFGWHLLGSATVLTLVLGGLFLGWYRWPGWYLADVLKVSGMLAAIDLALGPLLTLLIANPANPAKPRRELARDITIIAFAQLVALGYGAHALWSGRPLYYTFSVNRLEMVRAFEIDPKEAKIAQRDVPALAPHWYSRPRWVWAPLPSDEKAANAIMQSAITGGADVIDMPRLFKPWDDGLPELRNQLKKVTELSNLSDNQKARAAARMKALGFNPEEPVTMIMTGRADPLVVVFDPLRVEIRAEIEAH